MTPKICRTLLLALTLTALPSGKAVCACINDGNGNFICDVSSGSQTENGLSAITLIKTGEGETKLTGANDFSSISPDPAYISINGGTLSLTQTSTLTGDFTFNLHGGTLKTEGLFSFNNNLNFNGGDIDVSGEDSILSLTGNASGTLLTKSGLGLLELTPGAAYSGALTVRGGGVETKASSFTGAANITNADSFISFNESALNTLNASISGAGTFIKEGIGKLTVGLGVISANVDIDGGGLSISSSGQLTGDITINKGFFEVTGNIELNQTISFGTENEGIVVSSGKTLTLGSGAAITAKGCDGANCSEVIKDGAGTLIIDADASAGYFADTRVKQGILQISEGNSLGIAGYGVKIENGVLSITGTTAIDNYIEVLSASSEVLVSSGQTATLNANVTGTGVLNKTGAGTLLLGQGSLTNSGGTVILQGALQGSGASLLGSIQIDSGAALNILQESGGSTAAAISGAGTVRKLGAGILTLTAASPSFSGSFEVEAGALKGGSQAINTDINLLTADTSVIFDQSCLGADCEYAASVSGAGALVKTGAGLLALTGVNTYSGGTYLQNSVRDSLGIFFSSDSALGAAQSDVFISRSNLTLDQNQTVSTLRNFTFSNDQNSLTVLDNSTYSIGGVISGTSLTKLGAGELTLTAANTHTGGTQVTQGTLSAYAPAALGSGILSLTGGIFKPLADMNVNNNIYINSALGQGGFLVEAGNTLTLNGIISGGGTLNKSGVGTLELEYYNSYLGGVYAAGGIIKGNTDNILGNIKIDAGAEVEFNQIFSGYYTGDIDSAGTITKTGLGVLFMMEDDTLPGGLNVGALNVREGAVAASNALNGTVTVDSGAILSLESGGGGAFDISGALYLAQESDTDFKGDILVRSGGELAVFLEEGQSSKINLKDTDAPSGKGNLTIDAGGKINISANGVFAAPAAFDFLTYAGAFNFSGALEDVNIEVSNNKRLSAQLLDGGGTLSVLITRLLSNYSAAAGLKYNVRQLASAADFLSAAPSQDLEDVLNALDASPSKTADSLTQLGGFIYANLPNYFERFRDNAYLRSNRISSEEDTFSRNIWVQSVNNYARIKPNENSEDISNFSSGFAVGMDKYFADLNLTAGFFAAYARHDLKHNKTENLDGDEYQFGAYLLAQGEVFDFKGALSGAYLAGDIERNMHFVDRTASARVKSYGANLDLETGAKILSFSGINLRPFAGLTSSAYQTGSFDESGADSINLSSEGNTIFTSQGRVGLGLERHGKKLSYYADASVKQNLTDPQYSLSLAGREYKIKSADIGALYGVNFGAVKRFSESFSIYADAGADANANAQNYYLNFGLRSYW